MPLLPLKSGGLLKHKSNFAHQLLRADGNLNQVSAGARKMLYGRAALRGFPSRKEHHQPRLKDLMLVSTRCKFHLREERSEIITELPRGM